MIYTNTDVKMTHPERHVHRVHYHQASRCDLIFAQYLQAVSHEAGIAHSAGEIVRFHDDVADRVYEEQVLLLSKRLIRIIDDT